MNNEPKKIADADRIIHSLDGINRAVADPHLYTRILSGLIKEENWWTRMASFLSRPVVAWALVLVMAGSNLWIIFSEQHTGLDDNSDPLTSLAQEYHFQQPGLLDQNTFQP